MIEVVQFVASSGVSFVVGFVAAALLIAHKSKGTIIGKQGQEVTVKTSKGDRKFILAIDLSDRDSYAILQTNADESNTVTFAMKANQVKM